MKFSGFSIPDGAFLPPELIYLLPNISGAQLKVILAVLYHNLQFGGGESLSISDVEHLTGLSRPTVSTALAWLLREGILEREKVGVSYLYRVVVKFFNQVVKKFYQEEQLEESERECPNKLGINDLDVKDSLSDSLKPGSKNILLIQKLRAGGVYLRTAQDLVGKHDEETIERHLEYYRYALERNLAQGPGWLVLSLKEGWQAPLGFVDAGDRNSKAARRRYKDWDGSNEDNGETGAEAGD